MKGTMAFLLVSFIMLLTADTQVTAQLQREVAGTVINGSLLNDLNIEVLRGRDGRDGPDGRDGRDGLPGVQGQIGARGPPGPQGAVGPVGPRSGGVTYTRWGKSSCPNVTGTELVYTGRVGGSHYTHTGGGANHLCMPLDPVYTLSYSAGARGHVYVYGTEYEEPLHGTQNHNVPCAVCYVSTRETVLMIPAKTSCPTAWTREYYGYLMTEHHRHKRSNYECVDEDQESIAGSHANINGALLYHIKTDCSDMPCPPYDAAKELNCVVCTK